jgi:hypothetical protein
MAEARNNFLPWGLRPLQDFVFDELKNRSKSYGIDYSLDNYDGKNYNGPRTSWVRVCSNGRIPTDPAKRRNPPRFVEEDEKDFRDGFIMYGVNGFNDTYGIDDLNNQSKVVLGFDVNGEKHVLDESENQTFQNRPGPGVTSIESEFYGAGSSFNGLCRKVTIKWRANSIDQLNYMMPYFLSPMMTVVVEWGWNVYNPDSLIDLSGTAENLGQSADHTPENPDDRKEGSGLRGYYTNSQLLQNKIEISNGNYDAFIGRIYDFNFALTRDGSYECSTTVVNANYMFSGVSTSDASTTKEEKKEEEKEIYNFKKFVTTDMGIDNMFSESGFAGLLAKIDKILVGSNVGAARRTAEARGSETLQAIIENNKTKTFYNQSPKVKGTKNNVEKKYIRFDFFVDLLNYFYAKKFEPSTQLNFIDINDTKVCAYPLIKSTDKDVLIPNKYAPKFWNVSKNVGAQKTAGISQKEIKNVVNTEYGDLIYKLGETVTKTLNTTAELYYDDLYDLINYGNTDSQTSVSCEFPQLKSDDDPPGYFGYLKHIYISTELIKTELKANNKYEEFLKAILAKINAACNDIFKFRIEPAATDDNARITIREENYFPSKSNELKKVTQNPIVIGSINSSFILNASLDVKLSSQVAAQSLLGNAVYDYRNKKSENSVAQKDGPSALFVYTDRLFDTAAQSQVAEATEPEAVAKDNTETNIAKHLYVKATQEVSSEDVKNAETKFDVLKTAREGQHDELRKVDLEIIKLNDKLRRQNQEKQPRREVIGDGFSRRVVSVPPTVEKLVEIEKNIAAITDEINAEKDRKKNIEIKISDLTKEIAPAEAEFEFLKSKARPLQQRPRRRGNARPAPSRPVSIILVEEDSSIQKLFKNAVLTDADGNIIKNNMYIYNTIMPDTELSLEFLGIAGLRYLDTFTIDGVAEPYTHKKAIWQVDKVNSVVSGNSWKTVVVAKVRPHSFFAKNNNSVVASRPEPTPQNS